MHDAHDPIARLIREAGPRRDVSPERTERVRKAVHESWSARAGTKRSRWRWWALAACAAILSLGISLVPSSTPKPAGVVDVVLGAVLVNGEPPSPGQPVASDATIATTGHSRISLRLSSGASLRLDERTRLDFIEPDRVRLTSGAIYVDSGARSGPTIVETPLGEAHDVGTRFEVRVDHRTLLVRVRDGAVVVHGERERLDARSGEEVEIGRDGKVARRDVLPYAESWNWTAEVAPAFELRGASLGAFLDWAGRELGVEVRFGESALAEHAGGARLEGSIDGLTPHEALDVVIPSTGLDYVLEGGTLFLREMEGGS